MLFRILTERKNVQMVQKLASKYFAGFTLYTGTGFWKGKKEGNLTLEVIAKEKERGKVESLAKDIKKANKQEAVLVQSLTNTQQLI